MQMKGHSLNVQGQFDEAEDPENFEGGSEPESEDFDEDDEETPGTKGSVGPQMHILRPL